MPCNTGLSSLSHTAFPDRNEPVKLGRCAPFLFVGTRGLSRRDTNELLGGNVMETVRVNR